MDNIYELTKSGCPACNNQVLKELGKLQGVFGADMDRIAGRITVSHTDEVTQEQIAGVLAKHGFQEIKNS